MNSTMRNHLRWTEDELRAEIHRIGGLLERTARQPGERSRCAASYLVQLLRDREDALATLRVRTTRRRLS
jgi:hypothetical protein